MTVAAIDCAGEYIRFRFLGQRLLHHMVRNLVGALIHIGRRYKSGAMGLHICCETADRTLAAPTFPADGPLPDRLPTMIHAGTCRRRDGRFNGRWTSRIRSDAVVSNTAG
jgi:tRNA U38,U39,U40 pseudouridine synthase TruA